MNFGYGCGFGKERIEIQTNGSMKMNENKNNIFDICFLPREQQVRIAFLVMLGYNEHIAYDHVVYGTKI